FNLCNLLRSDTPRAMGPTRATLWPARRGEINLSPVACPRYSPGRCYARPLATAVLSGDAGRGPYRYRTTRPATTAQGAEEGEPAQAHLAVARARMGRPPRPAQRRHP